MLRHRFAFTMALVITVLVAASLVSLATGPVVMSPRRVFSALIAENGNDVTTMIVRTIRLPRAVAACVMGAALALAGLCFQVLLRNPLASETTLGVSSGAALGAVTAGMLHMTSALATPLAAFIGSVSTIAIVLTIARDHFQLETNATILAGVIFTSLANAALSLMLTIASPNELHTFFFWFMGSFANAEWTTLLPAVTAVAVLSLVVNAFAWRLNALAFSDEFAAQVGVPVGRTKVVLFGVASLLTAFAVSVAGTVGFVGLVVPRLAQLAVGADARRLIPVAAFGGAALCVTADVVSRTLLAPDELPVGVVTAFVGVPVFMLLMRRPV